MIYDDTTFKLSQEEYKAYENKRQRRAKDANEHMEMGQEIAWYISVVDNFRYIPRTYFNKKFYENVKRWKSDLYLENIMESYNCALEQTIVKYFKLGGN